MDIGGIVLADRTDHVEGAVMADIRIEGVRKNSSGFILMMLILLLFSIGFVTLMSVLSASPNADMGKQIILSSMALAVFLFMSSGFVKASTVDRILNSRLPLIFLAGALLLALVTAFFGEELNGARRWLIIGGVSVQSSEILKVAVIVYLSSFFANSRYNRNRKSRFIVASLLVCGCFGVILLQHDFSTAVMICVLILFMMLFARFEIRQIFLIVICGAALSAGAVLLEEYRRTRFMNYISGEGNFQSTWAIHAISNGGWLGCGWGAGSIKARGILPEAESDFIFAVLAEEFGFFGVLFLFFLVMVISGKGLFLADKVKHCPVRFFLVLGIIFSFLSQTLVNLAVVVGLLPTTGIPLPMFSQGGSSLMCTMFLMGLLVHIAGAAEENNG